MAATPPTEIGLPRPFLTSIERLLSWSESEWEVFAETLRTADVDRTATDVARMLNQQHPEFEAREVERVLAFLIQTRALTTLLETDTEGVARAVATAFKTHRTDVDDESLKSRIEPLLASAFVTIHEKSNRLSQEFGPILRAAQIFTDLRPVFAPGPTPSELTGFLISNTLVLEVEANGAEGVTRQFINLPPSSLKSLNEKIERALEKASYLSHFIETSGQTNLTPIEGD